jgi:hypothetical protein
MGNRQPIKTSIMKNYILTTAALLAFLFTCAQTEEKLDTIFANELKNVALFFPSPISQGITGNDHFVFTYNREKQQHFGLLQARPGEESNLLVIDAAGSVYSYIIKYKKALSRLNYFIGKSESIGPEKATAIDTVKSVKSEKELRNNSHYYQSYSRYLLSKKERIGRISKKQQGIELSLENIVFNRKELYFVILIENKSSLDYDLNYLNLSIHTRQKGKKKSSQRILKKPIFQFEVPVKIRKGRATKLVYVFPKFSLSRDRRAVLELKEKDGERDLKLKISHRFINNPN